MNWLTHVDQNHPGLTGSSEVMLPEAMAEYNQRFPVQDSVQYAHPSLPNASLINQPMQPEDLYRSTGRESMAAPGPEPMYYHQNYFAFDSNMDRLNLSELPQLERDRRASLPNPEPEPEPEPERAYKWIESPMSCPKGIPPVIRQESDPAEGPSSSNDLKRPLDFIMEDPTDPNATREKRRKRTRYELDKQKEEIRQLKQYGGACVDCYRMKKKCGPSTPCPLCKASNRECIRKVSPPEHRPSHTPELDMSRSDTQDSEDVNELLETMQTPPSSKMIGIDCDIDIDCDFGKLE